MEVVDPRELITGGLFREQAFREAVDRFDWSRYKDKPVLVQGCATVLPTWAYMIIAAKLTPLAKSVSYGEIKSPIPVSGKLGAA